MSHQVANDDHSAAMSGEHDEVGPGTAAHDREPRYRTLFDNMAEGFAIFGVVRAAGGEIIDLIYQQANKALEHQTGFDRARIIGQPLSAILTPADAQRWIPIFARAVDRGEPVAIEEYAETVGRWFDVSAYADGPDAIVVFYKDVSERKRAELALRKSEERHAFLLDFSDALRSMADPDEIMAVASRTIGRHLGVGRAGYGEVDADNEWFVVERDWTDGVMASIAGRHRVADFGPASVAAHRSDQAFIVDDTSNDPRFASHQAAFKALGLGASLLVPLVKEGRWIAGFYAQQSSPRQWSADDENLIRDVVERTWAAVERARAEGALRESENRLQALFDSVDQGFIEVEVEMSPDGRAVDWRYVALNPSFERLTGMEDVTGRLASEVAPDLEPEWAERYAQVVTTGRPIRFELPAAALGRWFDVNLVAVGAAGSCRIAAVYDDVTERKRADLALRDGADRQALLLAELQHRVRNTLTMVRSVARRTSESCTDVDDYVRHLDGRLASLARIQTILTRNPDHGVDLHAMVLSELDSQAALPALIRIEGPQVELSPRAAEVLSLAVHELTTNSTKYGVLSESVGTIVIRWAVDDRDGQPWLSLTWHEPVNATSGRPTRRTGFGTDLIVNRVPYELRGKGHLLVENKWVEARIEFPLVTEAGTLDATSQTR